MHPHHVHISYASPRVKSRTGSSEEKKQEVREKDADQHRTAYHQLGDGGKNGGAEKETDYRTGSSEVKKQEVREKDADQHRTAYHQLGDDGKEARAEKKADYRTGYSEEKKQDVREKNADQHRTAYARLLAEKAEAEAKRREDDANCPAGAGPGIVVVSDGQERNEDGCQKAHHWWPSARELRRPLLLP